MNTSEKPLWEQFLKPFFSTFLLNEAELKELYHRIDWEAGNNRFSDPQIVYPEYYQISNFHGIKGGYLTKDAAVTYDPITQYVLPPSENWLRQALIDEIRVYPRRILDLGCGTGSTTLMLKQTFPDAEVIGIDLSPYMLTMANYKSQKAGLSIQWLQRNAEKTGFPSAYFDLVTASLLFHETPIEVTETILQESFRLLTTGGQVIILDGHQTMLRQTPWLTNIFEEPYIQEYAAGSLDAGLGKAGFEAVKTDSFWLIHQITQGIKPISEQLTVSSFVGAGFDINF